MLEIKEWLKGVTYRPGWSVEYAGKLFDGRSYITVSATEPNVCDPSQSFHTMPLFQIPEGITREAFLDWVLDVCIPGVEMHERYEWFRVNGQKWRDPHAPGMPAFATDFGMSNA